MIRDDQALSVSQILLILQNEGVRAPVYKNSVPGKLAALTANASLPFGTC
ncbi:MAG: hypothetical protein KAJ65_05430 [Gammaproteobacteria bacterium]|jgi:hypothetical protein|nr:hypothetical protein [Gammaproteobacteria bacterium]